MLSTPLGPEADPVMLHGWARGVGGWVRGGCPCIRSSPSVITRAGLTARLARHHQSLNYLTDVSLASAADPVAERQRGAPERGALGGGVGWGRGREGGFNSYAVRVQPLITPQSFSAALSLNGMAGSEIEAGWCEPSMAGCNQVHLPVSCT